MQRQLGNAGRAATAGALFASTLVVLQNVLACRFLDAEAVKEEVLGKLQRLMHPFSVLCQYSAGMQDSGCRGSGGGAGRAT